MSVRAPVRLEEAESLRKASTPEPFSTSRTSNWVARKGGLPPYVQHIAHDLMEKGGKTESEAIRLAVGIVKNPPDKWGPEAKAAAKKAAAEWEAKKGASKPSARKLAEAVSLAERITLARAAEARLTVLAESYGGAGGLRALVEAKAKGFDHELKRVASADMEKERLEVHHGGQHVGTIASRPSYRPGEGDRWAARSVNGSMVGETSNSKAKAIDGLQKHLEDAPGRISPSPTKGRFLVAQTPGYSGTTSYKEMPSESAARYAAGLPEKKTQPEVDANVACLGDSIVCDVTTLELLREELPVAGLEELGFHPFDAALHPRGVHGKFSVSGRVRSAAGRSAGTARPPRRSAHDAQLHDANKALVARFKAQDARVKVRAADHIIRKTRNMSTDEAAHALASGAVKDTLTQHAPNGRLSWERHKLHFQIIQHFIGDSTPQQHPHAMFTAGGSASGKTSLRQFAAKGAVVVDPDEVRKMLPEYGELQKGGRADIASSATHEEASQIAKKITQVAMAGRRHILIDGVGDSGKGKFASKIAAARDAGYETEVRYAHTPVATAERRNEERFKKEGRLVPVTELRAKHAEVSQRHEEVAKLKGITIHIHDTGANASGRKPDKPPIISTRSGGKLEVRSWTKHREFEAKARG